MLDRYAASFIGRSQIGAVAAALALVGACAQTPQYVQPTPAEDSPAARAKLEPPASAPPPATPPEPRMNEAPGPSVQQRELRRTIFNAAWQLVAEKHFDPALGGVDWKSAREQHEDRAVHAPNDATFYRVANEMLGMLGQSHLYLSGPGAQADSNGSEPASGDGDCGLTVRVIEGRPTITAIRTGGAAEKAGLRPGFIVTHVGGWLPKGSPPSPRSLRPAEERFYMRLAIARRLAGPPGSPVTVRYLDNRDIAGQVVLERDPPRGKPIRIGVLAPMHPEVHASQLGDVGLLSFNLFLAEGILPEVQRAIDSFRSRRLRAVIIDLRGNPGGLGAMAIPVAARLVDKPITLGTIRFRTHSNSLRAEPPLGVVPFLGKVIILTDEGTASTSEILSAGLQEAGRASVVGESSLGAALASSVEGLPGGAFLQYVVADFRTPKGISVEGRGVQPDRGAIETRAALIAGRDVALDVALTLARASR